MFSLDTHGWMLTALAMVLIIAGVVALRAKWLDATRMPAFVGWALIVAGGVAWASAVGSELGVTYTLIGLGFAGYAAVAATIERRKAKVRDFASLAAEPEERPTNWRRAAFKSFLAIILAGVAAVGIGVAFAVAMPLGPHDRIVIGGLLVPVLWGAGMAWTLADAKTVRASILLTCVSAISYAIAFVPKMLTQ